MEDYLTYENYINDNNNTMRIPQCGSKISYNSICKYLTEFMYSESLRKSEYCFSREKFAMFFYYSEKKKHTYIIFKDLVTGEIIAYTTFENFFDGLQDSLKELAKKFVRK